MSKFEDFKEFKFLTINTPKLWKQGIISNGDLEFHDNSDNEYLVKTGGIKLAKYTEFSNTEIFQIPINTPIDLDLDLKCGLFYILDKKTGKLLIYDLRSDYLEWVKCLQFKNPRSIKVGRNNLYILYENNLVIIAKTNFQTRRIFECIAINPLDLAVDGEEENVFILDASAKQIYRVCLIDNRVYSLLNDKDEMNTIFNTSSIFIGKKDNRIYVLDSVNKKVIIFPSDHDNKTKESEFDILSLNGTVEFTPSGLAALDRENIFIGDIGSGKNYYPHPRKYSTKGPSQVLEYNRMSHKIIIDKKDGSLYVVNFSDNVIIKFELVNRFASSGTYISSSIDSGIQGLQWHKFVLDRDLPDPVKTKIEVFYYASDNKNNPTDGQWIKTPLSNPTDSLMFDAKGRYLWFKISLFSIDNRTTPTLHTIRAYFPRLSYLRYLPAIYQENRQSKEFLERFLSIFETFFVHVEEFNFTKFIDPRSTPEEFIPWLSAWLAIGYDENWPTKNFRKLIERAPELYKMRGTRKGIEKILLLYLSGPEELEQDLSIESSKEYKFMILENFQLDQFKKDDNYLKLFCNDPYTFCVLLNPYLVEKRKEETIRKIVENEKPAHTVGKTVYLEPWFYLGMHTYLGINTGLQEPMFILGDSAIGRDSVLDREENSGSIETSSRIGIDTHIS